MKYPNGPKSGWLKQAEEIVNGKIAINQEQLPTLLEWLRDYNWPGAKEIGDYLAQFADKLVEPVRIILRSGDNIWIYWITVVIIDRWPRSTCKLIAEDLKTVAYSFDKEGAHLETLMICAREKLDKPNVLRKVAIEKSKKDIENQSEYKEILSMIEGE